MPTFKKGKSFFKFMDADIQKRKVILALDSWKELMGFGTSIVLIFLKWLAPNSAHPSDASGSHAIATTGKQLVTKVKGLKALA